MLQSKENGVLDLRGKGNSVLDQKSKEEGIEMYCVKGDFYHLI